MRCLRCGHCCINYMVPIISDLSKPLTEDNIEAHAGGEACKHLEGSGPGHFSCKAHSHPDYHLTPCYAHGQVESNPETPCRIGEYKLKEVR